MHSPKYRVVIVGLHYAPESTGNAPYTTSLAEGLRASGHDVRVITGYPHYPEWRVNEEYSGWSRRETLNGVRLKRLRHYVPARPNFINRLHMELSFGLRAVFSKWGRPDVVLVVSPALFSSALVMLRARLSWRRPRIAIWIQDLYSRGLVETGDSGALSTWVSRVGAKFEALVLSSADGVVAIHERFRNHIVNVLEIKPSRVNVIRNWTHLPPSPVFDRDEARRELGWSRDDVVALHAGNMGKKQGLENLVHAARLAHEQKSNVRFVLMGDGNQRQLLETLATGIDNISFVASLPREEFQRALCAADVLLVNELPGVRDMSVPSKMTSYFNAAVPVIAATDQHSVTADELRAAKAGIRVDPANPTALLSAIERLCANQETAKSMGHRGFQFRQETLAEEPAIARYDEFISSLASSRDL
jgi:colanic acid biosynthesis glycosyl transferase WcaI